MKLIELKELVDKTLEMGQGRYDDLRVCILNNKPSVGPRSVTDVKNAHQGIDWEHSMFIIYPEKCMIEESDCKREYKPFKDEWGNSDWRDTGEMGG